MSVIGCDGMKEGYGQGRGKRKTKTGSEGQLSAGMERCDTDLGIAMISINSIIMVSSGLTAVLLGVCILNSPVMP